MEYLKIFTDFARSIEPLDDAERGRLFSAMLAYADGGHIPDLPGNERFVWPTAQLHIDREAAAATKKRECGALGGRPRKTTENQTKADETIRNHPKPPKTSKDKDKDVSSSPGGEDVPRPRGPYANVYLTNRELETFRAEYPDADERIRRMGEYLASKGKTYENYLAALRSWARKDAAERPPPASRPESAKNDWMIRYLKRSGE